MRVSDAGGKIASAHDSIDRRTVVTGLAGLGAGSIGASVLLATTAEPAVAVDADFVVADLSHSDEDPDAVPALVASGSWSYETSNGSVEGVEVELLIGDEYDSWSVVASDSFSTSSSSGSSSFDFSARVDDADEFDAEDFAPPAGETWDVPIYAAVRLRVLGVGEDYSYGSGVYTVENLAADLDASVEGEGELVLDD